MRPMLVFLLAVLSAILADPLPGGHPAQASGGAAPAIEVDVVALDGEGRFVEGLGAGDFVATVDGTRRPVLWVRRVSRGPGALAAAASRQALGDRHALSGAEPARTVLVAIDQGSIARGQERDVVQAAGLFLDRLGLNDRVAVVPIPTASEEVLAPASDRAETRAALARVTGDLQPPAAAPRSTVPAPLSGIPAEEARMTGLQQERVAESESPVAAAPPVALNALRAIAGPLARLPGRKTVAVFSAGLPGAANALVDDVAYAVASARAVIYAFGVRPSRGAEAGARLTFAPLQRLAAATGGAFFPPAKDMGPTAARAADELGACYVLGLEATPPRRGPISLRLDAGRKGVRLRASGWVVGSAPDAGDAILEPPRAEADSGGAHAAPPRAPKEARDEGELQVALARLFDYADGYERQYSMLVAEEDYRQSARGAGIRLRSDVLLVRPEEGGDWVSFRDVFEVDGKPVRDREERLRKLFLDATPASRSKLQAISEESARYNVGWVERTANVPLLPLWFLRPDNRGRFQFELAGRTTAEGVEAWRVRYTEVATPTLIGDLEHADVPVSGWFLLGAATGVVVETRMEARRGDASAEITVRYRNDPSLGLWVPAEMKETYARAERGAYGVPRRAVLEGHATYSNFRRFQVTTAETLNPPKDP